MTEHAGAEGSEGAVARGRVSGNGQNTASSGRRPRRTSRAPKPTTIKDLLKDKNSSWSFRHITGPMFDRMNDNLPGKYKMNDITQVLGDYNWCRFCEDSNCYYPKDLDVRATEIAGYDVWIPQLRGRCHRYRFDDQKACPIAEPGPKSGEANWLPKLTGPGRPHAANFVAEEMSTSQSELSVPQRPVRPRKKKRAWSEESRQTKCATCGHVVRILVDGRVSSHFRDGDDGPKGHHLSDKCLGSHVRVALNDTKIVTKPPYVPMVAPSKHLGWIALVELLAVLGLAIWVVMTALHHPDALQPPVTCFVIAALLLIATILCWINDAAPGAVGVVFAGLGAAVATKAVVDHHHDQEQQRIKNAVADALREHDRSGS